MAKIGIFDSGYGGLTILRAIRARLPEYDYIYLGDNARAPYGSRSFDIVYQFTLEAVKTLFSQDCNLVILACNTASAKALRSIQQEDLPVLAPHRRVLGVIRPTIEALGDMTKSRHVGVLATPGTVLSHSYSIELAKLFDDIVTTEHACPLWVPLVENGEADSTGADYFVKKYISEILQKDPLIDTLVLGCTHYPLLYDKIRAFTPEHINILAQGNLVADSLADYLHRHHELADTLSKNSHLTLLTSETPEKFNQLASLFLHYPVKASHIDIPAQYNHS